MSAAKPVRIRKVDSAETIKALADPLRLRILTLLMGDRERAWTVKEIAASLDQSVTKLYHHVKQLEQAQLILDVETRLVSGIVEHRYAAGQRGLEFDDALYGSPETKDASIANVSYLLDEVRDEVVGYLGRADAEPERMMLSKARLRLTADEADELRAAMENLLAEYTGRRDTKARKALPRHEVLMVMVPQPED